MVKPAQVDALVKAGAVKDAQAVAEGRKWRLELRTGLESVVVATRRGEVRRFASLDSLAKYLRDYGIGRWGIDATGWTPEQRETV